MPTKVFISWSGMKSQLVAAELKGFLALVLPNSLVWFSSDDISGGTRWGLAVATELETTDYGVIALTREALESSWVAFEAGAIGKSVDQGRVCPYLIDIEPAEVHGPLSQFQAKRADEAGTWGLVQGINLSDAASAINEGQLRSYFDAFWPKFGAILASLNQANQSLPLEIRRALISVLSRAFYKQSEIERVVAEAGVSRWEINFSQAAIHIWREVVRVAADEKRLGELVDRAAEDAPVIRRFLGDIPDQLAAWRGGTPA